jgi:hypothetical protein
MTPTVVNKNFSFDHSVGVLIKAYLSGDLQKGNCSACAVGNLIADALEIKFTRIPTRTVYDEDSTAPDDSYYVNWVGCTSSWFDFLFGITQAETPGYSSKEQILSTGYTIDQLRLIEYTFELPRGVSTQNPAYDEYLYRGLLAVVGVLAKIHGVDLATSEQAETSITRAYAQLSESVAR